MSDNDNGFIDGVLAKPFTGQTPEYAAGYAQGVEERNRPDEYRP